MCRVGLQLTSNDLQGLLDVLSPKAAAVHFLPPLADVVRGEAKCNENVRGALLQPSTLLAIIERCGLAAYMDTLHLSVVSCLEGTHQSGTASSASVDLPALAAQVLLSILTY